tara:strand:- start:302 stop:2878 length:2577 start_codon:yes stop_codon:yes gene_type:complete
MAEDLVMKHLEELRDSVLPRHTMITDWWLLILAEMFGSVDPETQEPLSTRYTASLSNNEMVAILDGLQDKLEDTRVSPGEAVGVIAGQSIGEPFTQAIMRTFHYAGVSTGANPEQALTAAVGHHPNNNHSIAIALDSSISLNESKCEAVRRKILRFNLGDFFDVKIDSEFIKTDERMLELENQMKEFDDDKKYQVSYKQSALFPDEMIEVYGDPTPEFEPILTEYKQLRAKRIDNSQILYDGRKIRFSMKYKIFPSNDIPHGWSAIEDAEPEEIGGYSTPMSKCEPIMGMKGLRESLVRIMETTRGKLKDPTDVPGLYSSVRFFDDGDDLIVAYPKVKSMHILGLTKLLPRLQLCGGCYSALQSFKLHALKLGPRIPTKIPQEEKDDKELTKVEKYFKEILNDPSMFASEISALENPHLGYGYDVGRGATGIEKKEFTFQEISHSRACTECGGGWWNINAALVRIGGSSYEDESWEKETRKDSLDEHDYEKMTGISHNVPEGLDPTNPSNWDYGKERMAEVRVNWPYSRPGAYSDVPLQYNHSGKLIYNPSPGEYFIVMKYAEPDALKDTKWASTESNKTPGHFANCMQLPEIDFARTSTNDVHQVNAVLGLEAARIVLFQNIYNILSGGKMMSGADAPVDMSHYLLLVDMMCEGPEIKGAQHGQASRKGAASTKGAGNAVLAIAYEQEVNVIMQAAARGLSDPLLSPKSAEIAGATTAMGSGWDERGGRFEPVKGLEMDFMKNQLKIAAEELQHAAFALEIAWFTTETEYGVHLLFIPPIPLEDGSGDSPLPKPTKDMLQAKYDTLMADDDFVAAYQRYTQLLRDYESMMELHFDKAGVPVGISEPRYPDFPVRESQ